MTEQADHPGTDGDDVDVDAVVVGAGFGGLRMLHELRTLGVSALVIEEGIDVGGTWHWNRYPGARTDSESWTYCYSFSKELLHEWEWPERYSAQPDVLRYLQYVADRFDLRRDIRFGTRVASASYDDAANRWSLITDRGEVITCRYAIFATGPLSRPLPPPYEGLDEFTGEWHVTARWPADAVDVRGRRIAVIGTGATGIQVVPVVAEDAEHVTVFQRTPNYVIPARNRELDATDRAAILDRYDEIWALTQRQTGGFSIPEAEHCFDDLSTDEQEHVLQRAWDQGGFQFLFSTFRDLMLNERANDAAAEFIRRQIRAIVRDPATAEALCPKGYPLGAKRPPLGHWYYEAFNRPNVTLVDLQREPIERITATGVRAAVHEHTCDLLVFATGFDGSTGALMAMDIRGRSAALNDKWSKGPRTFLGLTVDDFPNLFLISGPQTPFGNIPVIVENEVRWIGRAIDHAITERIDRLEPSAKDVEGWVETTRLSLEATLMRKGALAHSWFLGANVEGKANAPLFFFGRADSYFHRLEDVAARGFDELKPAALVQRGDAS